jgi:hypothetical protein
MKIKLVALLLAMGILVSCAGREDNIPVGELPAVVKQAIDQRYPGAQYVSAERETENGVTSYEVEIIFEGRQLEIDVTADGVVSVDE